MLLLPDCAVVRRMLMRDIVEIRWHGRGGQGAKTAATLLAEAASEVGRYVQAFPEYGPERMGAPVQSFNRISSEKIRIHSGVTNPSIVAVLDATLIETAGITDGLSEDGIILVNTDKNPAQMREEMQIDDYRIFTVDASTISVETLGREIPNTPMLGALISAAELLDYEDFMGSMKNELEKKFGARPEIVSGNLEAIERAYQEVQGE